MKLKEIVEILHAKVICGEEFINREVATVLASDLMSDVLTINSDNMLLLTGLVNIQTIRTAEMSDIQIIILVRDKKASPEIIEMAEENEIVLIESQLSTYQVCGLLYSVGLPAAN